MQLCLCAGGRGNRQCTGIAKPGLYIRAEHGTGSAIDSACLYLATEVSPQAPPVLGGAPQPQSIGSLPISRKYSFALENGLLPKNPLCAENGDGCGDVMT